MLEISLLLLQLILMMFYFAYHCFKVSQNCLVERHHANYSHGFTWMYVLPLSKVFLMELHYSSLQHKGFSVISTQLRGVLNKAFSL